MDSINQNQPEENRQDLRGTQAVERVREMVKKTESCFFCTAAASAVGGIGGGSTGVRPMSVQQVDDFGVLWFLSANDSHKNLELEKEPGVRLFFQGSEHSGFLTLNGTAAITLDHAKIKELWEPVLKTWFTGGVDDPRITAIGFTPRDGYYWDNKHGNAVAGIKMAVGAVIGKTLDDSIEGSLTF